MGRRWAAAAAGGGWEATPRMEAGPARYRPAQMEVGWRARWREVDGGARGGGRSAAARVVEGGRRRRARWRVRPGKKVGGEWALPGKKVGGDWV